MIVMDRRGIHSDSYKKENEMMHVLCKVIDTVWEWDVSIMLGPSHMRSSPAKQRITSRDHRVYEVRIKKKGGCWVSSAL